MKSDTRPIVSLPFSQAVTVLMQACDISPSARPAFEARVRQLRRLGVASRAGKGAGPVEYGYLEISALALAIKLMAAFMVPSFAARYVTEKWSELAPALLSGARMALAESYLENRQLGDETVLWFAACALDMLGNTAQHGERYVGALGQVVASAGTETLKVIGGRSGAAVVVDTRSFMPTLTHGFVDASIGSNLELFTEFDRLRYS